MSDIQSFIDKAWSDHGDHADDVARRLADSASLIESADDVAPYVRLVTHVYGEHLARWDDGIRLLRSIRELPPANAHAPSRETIERSIAVLRYGSGDAHALDALATDDRIAALAIAAAALAGLRRFGDAIEAYDTAVALAPRDLRADSPAARALAIGGNNLAVALEEKFDRDRNETDGMVRAARAGLEYWTLAGTWLEEERAHYRLARSLLAACDAHAAIESAKRCVDVCARNDAPAFERFFAHAVLAIALRAAGDRAAFESARADALAWHARVAPDERPWCDNGLAELEPPSTTDRGLR